MKIVDYRYIQFKKEKRQYDALLTTCYVGK